MRYLAKSIPPISKGVVAKGKRLTVPDQSMSLKEILERFVRREPLPIDMGGEYVESEYDLEKVSHMDLTEKAEFIERQKDLQKQFDKQEKARERARVNRVREQEREKIRAEEAARVAKPGTPGVGSQ